MHMKVCLGFIPALLNLQGRHFQCLPQDRIPIVPEKKQLCIHCGVHQLIAAVLVDVMHCDAAHRPQIVPEKNDKWTRTKWFHHACLKASSVQLGLKATETNTLDICAAAGSFLLDIFNASSQQKTRAKCWIWWWIKWRSFESNVLSSCPHLHLATVHIQKQQTRRSWDLKTEQKTQRVSEEAKATNHMHQKKR